MIAFPQRGSSSLVAVLAALFVLPIAVAAQDPGTPSSPTGVLGRPLHPETPAATTGEAEETVEETADRPASASQPAAPTGRNAGPLGRPLGAPAPAARAVGPEAQEERQVTGEELGATVVEDGALAGRPLDGGALAGRPMEASELGRRADGTLARFSDLQLRYPRVRGAVATRTGTVNEIFRSHGIQAPREILFRVFKREQLMEVWARGEDDPTLTLVTTYAVCGTSGELGPKRLRGDEQIPEGFYTIDIFNPTSQYHLSLGVDYPNAVDRFRGRSGNLGGDIFVHGGCATVGCVPVTDEGIEEVYLMALMARDAGQHRIPIHLFPTRLDDDGFAWLRDTFGEDHEEFEFWLNLREGYLAFERSRTIPFVDHHRGRYHFPRGVAVPR